MTSYNARSFLWVDDLPIEGTRQLFSRATQIKKHISSGIQPRFLEGKQVALVFNEASTRTKMSFQLAAQRLGAQCLIIDNVKSSSMSKGETFSDTFWTLHSIKPDLFVIRCGGEDPLDQVVQESQIPVVNAGFGSKAHPTQALLDAFTIDEHFGKIEGLKVLFVGDIDHSRVAASNLKLLKAFGAEVKTCAPSEFRKNNNDIENIETLSEAIEWCDVYVGLRVQFERHSENSKALSREDFVAQYSLDQKGLQLLNPKAIVMHPGPVNWGVEFQEVVQQDPRLKMWQQKENGVYTRAALMEILLKG